MILAGAKPVALYADGSAAGGRPVTRHDLGGGRAWYVSARTDAATTAALLTAACESAGITAPARAETDGAAWPRELEIVRRAGRDRRYITLVNHGESTTTVFLGDRAVSVPGGDVRVIDG